MFVLVSGCNACCRTSLRYSRLQKLVRAAAFHCKLYKQFQTSSSARTIAGITPHRQVNMETKPRKQVIVSLSENIHANLALEDWLYDNADLDRQSYLLLWRNEPTIVIGRHQNPWLECNVPEARRRGIPLVRRKSGGGTVYHDKGNLNCSILTNRKSYNRKQNLKMIVEAVQTKWDIPLTVNSRHDILLDGLYKVSGTAAKLSTKRAYHHFTLLFDADLYQVHDLLHSQMVGAGTKATESVSAPVRNLSETDDSITFESLTRVLADHYLLEEMQEEQKPGIRYLQPNEEDFPGLERKISKFQQWDWTYGHTPKFSISRKFVLPGFGVMTSDARNYDRDINHGLTLQINISTDKGVIMDICFQINGNCDIKVHTILDDFKTCLSGKQLERVTLECCFDYVASTNSLDDGIFVSIRNCLMKTLQFC